MPARTWQHLGSHKNQGRGRDDRKSGQSRNSATLITGANGEFGHGLIRELYRRGSRDLVALDIRPLDASLQPMCRDSFVGDIVDEQLLSRILATYDLHTIYHLAALLSTRAEFTPEAAHHVNVGGTLNLLKLAAEQASLRGESVKFLFPSSIAVYGIPDLETKSKTGRVKEHEFLYPTTMYGCNKLACEQLGRYYKYHYRQLAKDRPHACVDFRSIRFPGVISAFTVPSGGTSDFAPEMIHAAAAKTPYHCFVRPDTRIPFVTMPEAITSLIQLEAAPTQALTRTVYNIAGFAPSADEIRELVQNSFPDAQIDFLPDEARQGIVDTWPEDVIDSAARTDWGYQAQFTLEQAFEDYLLPNIRKHYAQS